MLLKQGKKISVECIGKKAYDALLRTFANTDVRLTLIGEKLKSMSAAELQRMYSRYMNSYDDSSEARYINSYSLGVSASQPNVIEYIQNELR